METSAKIGLGVKNGKIGMRVQLGALTQAEVAMLIEHLDIIRDDLKLRFRKRIKKVEG